MSDKQPSKVRTTLPDRTRVAAERAADDLEPSRASAPESIISPPSTRWWPPTAVPVNLFWRTAVLSVFSGALLAVLLTKLLTTWQVYTDLVVGGITYSDANKSRDYAATILFLVIAPAICYGFLRLLHRVQLAFHSSTDQIAELLNTPLILFAYYAGVQIGGYRESFWPLEAGLFLLLLALFLATSLKFREDPRSELFPAAARAFAMNLLLIAVGALAIKFLSGLIRSTGSWHWDDMVGVGYVLAGVVALFALAVSSNRLEQYSQRLTRALYVFQIPLPLLFLIVLPRDLIYRGQSVSQSAPKLLIVVLAFTAAALVQLTRRFLATRRTVARASLRPHLEPLCLVAIPLCLVASNVLFPGILGDDFHLGEQLIPWQQFTQFHKLPYIDLIPIHGLMPFLRGAFNSIFFDGTAAHYEYANLLLTALATTATFLAIYAGGGLLPALLSCLCLKPFDRFYLFGPILLILLQPKLLRAPLRWICLALFGTLLAVIYNVPVGIAVGVGLAPMLVHQMLELRRRGWREERSWLAVLGVLLVALICAFPLEIAFARYVIDNGAVNTVANGLQWQGLSAPSTPGGGAISSVVAFEALKYMWLPVALFLLAPLMTTGGRLGRGIWGSSTQLCIAVFLALLFLTPWSMGRIDAGSLSRPGSLSVYVVAVFLPLVWYRYAQRSSQRAQSWPIVLAALLGLMSIIESPYIAGYRQIADRLEPTVAVPDSLTLIEGQRYDLPNIGTGYLAQSRWQQLRQYQQAMARLLAPGDTYLDLTNRQALYTYLGKPVPTVYGASYVAAGSAQQREMVSQLRNARVHAALIGPAPFNIDGTSGSLRTYLLYRYVMERMQPCQVSGLIFMVDDQIDRSKCDPASQDPAILDQVFAQWNLAALPVAWGRSWETLSRRFQIDKPVQLPQSSGLHSVARQQNDFVLLSKTPFDEARYLASNPDLANAVRMGHFTSGLQHYQLYGKGEGRPGGESWPDPFIECDVSTLGINPKYDDYLLLDIQADVPAGVKYPVEVRWASDVDPLSLPISLEAQNGRLIVPLGSYPRWLRANRIVKLRLDIGETAQISRFQIPSMALLHYKRD